MNGRFRSVIRKLDTGGLEAREERRDVARKQQQSINETVRKSFNSAFAEANRQIDLRKLAASDPAMLFFLSRNTSIDSV